jgi:arylsulfatase
VFIKDDHLIFDYNLFMEHHVLRSDIAVPTGASVVGARFRRRDNDGVVTLVINDQECGAMELPFVMRIISSIGMSVGQDHGSPVSKEYEDEFAFEGKLQRVDIQLVSPRHAQEGEILAREGMARQ